MLSQRDCLSDHALPTAAVRHPTTRYPWVRVSYSKLARFPIGNNHQSPLDTYSGPGPTGTPRAQDTTPSRPGNCPASEIATIAIGCLPEVGRSGGVGQTHEIGSWRLPLRLATTRDWPVAAWWLWDLLVGAVVCVRVSTTPQEAHDSGLALVCLDPGWVGFRPCDWSGSRIELGAALALLGTTTPGYAVADLLG